ncbi:hypothetical protein [Streptomyces sp. DSM 41013]
MAEGCLDESVGEGCSVGVLCLLSASAPAPVKSSISAVTTAAATMIASPALPGAALPGTADCVCERR